MCVCVYACVCVCFSHVCESWLEKMQEIEGNCCAFAYCMSSECVRWGAYTDALARACVCVFLFQIHATGVALFSPQEPD